MAKKETEQEETPAANFAREQKEASDKHLAELKAQEEKRKKEAEDLASEIKKRQEATDADNAKLTKESDEHLAKHEDHLKSLPKENSKEATEPNTTVTFPREEVISSRYSLT